MKIGPEVKRVKDGLRVAVAGRPYVYHADHLLVPESMIVELPKKVSHEEGCFAGQGAQSLHLLRKSGIQIGEVAVVISGGLEGLIFSQILKSTGALPIYVDDSEFRRKKARAIGIHHVFQPTEAELVREVGALTEGNGADYLFLMDEFLEGDVSRFAKLLCYGGTTVIGVPLRVSLDVDSFYEREIRVISGWGGGPGWGDRSMEGFSSQDYKQVARWNFRENMQCFCELLAERKVQLAPLITDRFPFDRAPILYDKASQHFDSVLGGVLTV